MTDNKQRIAYLRRKIRAGKANQLEMSEVATWDSKRTSSTPGRKPKMTGTRSDSPVGESGNSDGDTATVEIHTTLPGMGDEANLPPMSVSPDATQGNTTSGTAPDAGTASQPQSGGVPPTPGHSASNASTNGNNGQPKMSQQEAEANGKMIADLATQIVSEFNGYNLSNGGIGVGAEFLKVFHFSCYRMATKYAGDMAEDDYHAAVIVGTAGFVGYQSFKTSRRLKRDGKDPNSVERHSPTPGPGAVAGPPPPVVNANGPNGFPKLPRTAHDSEIADAINPNRHRVF